MMKWFGPLRGLLVLGVWLNAGPAVACLGCSCGGGSGTTGDLGATGGLAGLFAQGQRWLIQESLSFRNLTGHANERGDWFPMPTGGQVQGAQATLGLYFFPQAGSSIGIQIPGAGQRLSKSTWGSFGAMMPTDASTQVGFAAGDVLLQGTHIWLEGENGLLGAWAGLGLPTGYNGEDPARLAGSGTFGLQGGLLGLIRLGEAEFVSSVGGQGPLGAARGVPGATDAGEALVYQVFGNYPVGDRIRVGVTLSGQSGVWRQVGQEGRSPLRRFSIIPGLQWAFGEQQGLRLAFAINPPVGQANTSTDWTLYAVGYHFVR